MGAVATGRTSSGYKIAISSEMPYVPMVEEDVDLASLVVPAAGGEERLPPILSEFKKCFQKRGPLG